MHFQHPDCLCNGQSVPHTKAIESCVAPSKRQLSPLLSTSSHLRKTTQYQDVEKQAKMGGRNDDGWQLPPPSTPSHLRSATRSFKPFTRKWFIQAVHTQVIHSSRLHASGSFKPFTRKWFIQAVHTQVVHSSRLHASGSFKPFTRKCMRANVAAKKPTVTICL
jgi:hypothetical protein